MPRNTSHEGAFYPVLTTIVVVISTMLAIKDKEIRPAYFRLAEIVVICNFQKRKPLSDESNVVADKSNAPLLDDISRKS